MGEVVKICSRGFRPSHAESSSGWKPLLLLASHLFLNYKNRQPPKWSVADFAAWRQVSKKQGESVPNSRLAVLISSLKAEIEGINFEICENPIPTPLVVELLPKMALMRRSLPVREVHVRQRLQGLTHGRLRTLILHNNIW